MTSDTPPTEGPPRRIPCTPCMKDQIADVDNGSWKACCSDQITKKGKARSCYQCAIKKTKCIAADHNQKAVKAWVKMLELGGNADNDKRYNAAFSLKTHHERLAAAIPPDEESWFGLINETVRNTASAAQRIEAAFEEQLGDISDHDDPLYQRQQARSKAEADKQDKLAQDLKKCKSLKDSLRHVSELSCRTMAKAANVEAKITTGSSETTATNWDKDNSDDGDYEN